ncbi:MAG: alpha/beta hydrolase [Desulfobulbaceae bacterium]|nr:MAG: alpha/beta hydrolase [Desulfobulbaceae bacterium]
MNTRISLLIITIFCLFLGGCQPKVYLMPPPIVFDQDTILFELSNTERDENLLYTGYATNRLPFEKPDRHNIYSIFPADTLRFGFVVHRVGDPGMSWEELRAISLDNARSEDLLIKQEWLREQVVIDISEAPIHFDAGADGFFQNLNNALDKTYDKDLLVYVHGANSNFYRATAQGAQYYHFTGHNTVVITFSWPSAENILRYKTDVLHAKKTVPAFAHLIEILAERTKARHINILAYSAGAQVVTPGLVRLREQYPGMSPQDLKMKYRIGEVYFAAPDTDFSPFIDRYLAFKDIVERTTININFNDSVLRFAAIQNGLSRLGRPNLSELTDDERINVFEMIRSDRLDILDVGNSDALQLGGAHDSWYNHPWVSNDLLLLMLHNADPDDRGLERYEYGSGSTGYYFPENYQEIMTELRRISRETFLQDYLDQ